MGLFIEIYNGERKGQRITVEDGIVIGRKEGHILLSDPKISGKHVKIELKEGGFHLVDLGSANGIKVDGERFDELLLSPGGIFVLGNTSFRVMEDADLTREIVIEDAPPLHWTDILKAALIRASGDLKNRNSNIQALPKLVTLNITQGIQHGTKWTVGYGPRSFGANTPDYLIEEYDCPPIAFELLPQGDGVFFRTKHPDIVSLNGENVASKYLQEGDIVEIRNTKLRVSFEGN